MPYVAPGQGQAPRTIASIPKTKSSDPDPQEGADSDSHSHSSGIISATEGNVDADPTLANSSEPHQTDTDRPAPASPQVTRPGSALSISPTMASPDALSGAFTDLSVDAAGPSSAAQSQIGAIADPDPASADTDGPPSRRTSGAVSLHSTTSSLPALDPHSASCSSFASFESTPQSSPATTADGAAEAYGLGGSGDKDEGIVSYKEGLYRYTQALYLEAKLSSAKAEKRRTSVTPSNQFGAAKQSGMERLAAKKALAKRLNG